MKRAAFDEDFPRGGGDAYGAAEPGARGSQSRGGGAASRPTKRRAVALPRVENDQDDATPGLTSRVGTFVEQLKYKSLSVGTKLWGVVVDVNTRRLTVGLPSGLRGVIRVSETSDVYAERSAAASLPEEDGATDSEGEGDGDGDAAPSHDRSALPLLTALFAPGQRVRCLVIRLSEGSNEQGRRVELSLRLSKLHAASGFTPKSLRPGRCLAACVTSVEDHGYMLSFGLPTLGGFLPRQAAPGRASSPLAPGALLETVVTEVDVRRRLVTVTCEAEALRGCAPLAEEDQPVLQALQPGDLVSCRVRAVLADGLSLSFLGLFSGTVDWFHLGRGTQAGAKPLAVAFPQHGRLGTAFAVQDRCKARILTVDPATKKLSLTLRPEHVAGLPAPELPRMGTRLPGCTIRRIDPSVGLLLQLPLDGDDDTPPAYAGYAHISNASDTRVDKLESAFKVGQRVDGRVVGQRHMDGLVAVSLKRSVVDAPFFTLDDITVGALVEVTLVAVDISAGGGATVALAPGLKGTVPLAHCSDAGTATAAKKLRAGARLKARVLQVDSRTRRVLATLKPSVVNSKFPPLCSVADASPGQVAHGCITGIQAYGVFVAFFGDVKGLAHARHCGLAPGQSLQDAFRVGEAIKATVLGVTTHATRGPVLDLSLGTPAAAAGAAAADEGTALTLLQEVPTAVVSRVVDDAVYLRLDAASGLELRLEAAHLADDAASSAALLTALTPGAPVGPLLVLATTPRLAVTLKPALVTAAAHGSVPGDLAAVSLGDLLTGFVASVSPAGVFVRFAQRLTGLAPTAALFDGLSTVTPDTAFPLGRSVCGVVTALDTAAGRLTLSLRPSDVAAKAGAASLRALLHSTTLTDAVVAAKTGESLGWAAKFPRGKKVACTIAQVKPSMGVLDLEGDDDAVGLTLGPHLQEAGNPGVGEAVTGIVLGCNASEGLVDIGIRPQLVQPAAAQAGGKRKAKAKSASVADLAAGEAVRAEVELVKRDYLVVSLPDHGRSIALLQVRALGECHTTPGAAGLDDTFAVGQALRCVAAGPLGTAGDDVQLLTLEPGRGGGAARAPRGDAEARTGVRSGIVTAVLPLELHVRLPSGRQGRIHVTQLPPAAPPKKRKKGSAQPPASPLAGYHVGDTVQVHVTGTLTGVDAPDGHSMLSLALVQPDGGEGYKPPTLDALVPGGVPVVGYIDTVTDDAAWVALAPALRGRLSALDAVDDGHAGSAALTERFVSGQVVTCYVLSCDAHKRHVDLSTAPPGDEEDQAPGMGALVRCRVVKVVPGIGLYVQCRAPRGAHVDGRIAMTDLGDTYTPTPCDALPPGTILSAVVVGTSSGGHLDLSLRPSRGAHPRDADGDGLQQPEIKALSDVAPGAVLHGFVKSATPKGVFVTLGRGLDARVKLSNLADAFVPSPETAFPPGSRVTGRVLAVETGTHRIELSLKESDFTGGAPMGLADLTVGQVVRGTVKRVETFGVFVTLAGGGVTGMVHISMFADGPRIKDLQQRIAPGKKVVCKVMAADTDTGRLSLGMKASLFEEGELQEGDAELNAGTGGDGEDGEPLLDMEAVEEEEAAQEEEEDAPMEPPARKRKTGAAPAAAPARMQPAAEVLARLMGGGDDEELAFKWAAPETGRAHAQVDGEDEDDPDAVAADPAAVAAAAKRARRKEKKAREEALRVRERALAAGDSTPHSEADFQRLLVGSPNSSYLWIAYMAHLAGLGEPAQARAVAERALSGQPGSISYREQREQLNVWVAWMNLEAAYGEEPRDAAVGRVFAAACKQSDHKALHLALVGTHQRAGHKDAATAAAGALTRAFRTSCKAWLRAFSLHLGFANPGAARGCLDAAVQALPKRKHAKFLVAAGLAEFRIGDPERGRALLEGVLAAQPRRADVWNVYLDAEAKHGGDTLRARALFQRAVCCGLPPKRCKPLFKKFLAWERANGAAADVARVKQMAAEYVSSQVEHLVHDEDGDE